MDRILLLSEGEKLIAATIAIYSIPRVINRSDALVIFPGLGETQRVSEAIHWWQEQEIATRFLLVAGHNTKERTSQVLDIDRLRQAPFFLQRTENVYCEIHADHTKAQADWVAKKVQTLRITSVALFVSPYHLLRAFLTLLKSFVQCESVIPIIPVPVSVGLHTPVPEFDNVEMWKMIAGEVRRIQDYQLKGDVAGFSELNQYLEWLWKQNILTSPLNI